MNPAGAGTERYRLVKRTIAFEYAAVFGWYGFLGGYMSLKSGDPFGWFAIAVGIAMVALPFTRFFRSRVNSLASRPGFAALVFVPNLALVVMFGSIASLYLKDPFLTYNDANTLAAVVFGGATVLAATALLVNAIAYGLDLKSATSSQG
jgi:hypothetical protein